MKAELKTNYAPKAQKNDNKSTKGTPLVTPRPKARQSTPKQVTKSSFKPFASHEDARVKVVASHIFESLVAEGDLQNTISVAPRPSIIIVRLAVH